MEHQHHAEDWSHSAHCAFDIVAGEFMVVTADAADLRAYGPLTALLQRMRKAFGIDAVFIAEWAQGEPVVHRGIAGYDEGDLLHATYAQQLLDADAVHAVPVVTQDGFEHGTLCCRADASQREALRSVARLIAAWFNEASLSLSGLTPLRGDSVVGALATQF